jgi:MmeI, helicase spacer domain
MNHFMARLIFCFFAENTDIFSGKGLFNSTAAVQKYHGRRIFDYFIYSVKNETTNSFI